MWTCGVKCKTAAFLVAVFVTLTALTLYLYGQSFVSAVPSLRSIYRLNNQHAVKKDDEKSDHNPIPPEKAEAKETTSNSQTFQFDMMGNDVLVFLHIQKTGGSHFGRKLVTNLSIDKPCTCQIADHATKCCSCKCYRPNSRRVWLFSRYSVGWPCGVHADMTELKDCVPKYFIKLEGRRKQTKLRYLYLTNIREPVSRFLSEFRNVQRGATWADSLHKCNGRVPTSRELPRCYSGDNWSEVDLDAFMKCPSNLAINRQTRMLADLSLVNCYKKSGVSQVTRDRIMLQNAKENLKQMAFFGLVEYQRDSQYLFEQMIGIKFDAVLRQKTVTNAGDTLVDLNEETVDRITRLNHLDVDLYQFGKELFMKRLKYFQEKEKKIN